MSSLPTIPHKHFDIKSKFIVPKGKITMSPFTVGLESILLQVKDAEDEAEKMAAIKQIIEECCKTPGINVSELPIFLVELIFLRLRQNSVGEIVELQYECTNEVEGKPCGNEMKANVDLREFDLKETAGHTNKIMIHDPIGVVFKYPSIAMFEDGTNVNDDTDVIVSCIDMIFEGDTVFPSSEHKREQLVDFWNNMSLMQKKEVYDKFFNSMPHMHYKKSLTCTKCKHVHELEFNSVQEVFQS